MVFGWGKKKHDEKSVQEVSQNKEILLADIPSALSKLDAVRLSQILSDIGSLRNSTEPLIEDLIKIGNLLEKDDLKVDDIDKHLAIIIVRGKKQVINVIKKDVVSLPKISSLEDAEKLNALLGSLLKKVGDVLGRQTRVIHIFAKKYAAQLKNNLEIMNSNHSEIRIMLKNYELTRSAHEEITKSIVEIKKMSELHKEKSQKIVDTDQLVQSTGRKTTLLQDEIDGIKSSDGYQKYVTLKHSLDDFAGQKSKIRNQIGMQFTKISRPLSRYEYASSLDKDQKSILSALVAEPFDVITPENRDSVITILENVRKAVSSGSISVKDVEKTFLQITETEESFDVFAKQISQYTEEYLKLQSKVDSLVPKSLGPLEADLAKSMSLDKQYMQRSETLQGETSEIDTKIPKLISEIEQKLLQFSNTRYTIQGIPKLN